MVLKSPKAIQAHNLMDSSQKFPAFDDIFSDLNWFILHLVKAYEAGILESWGKLEKFVNVYFTPKRMQRMESIVPGWQKMASYSGGITLVHITCVFLGMFMLPEFQRLTPIQQQLAKWIVLFHDVAKFHIRGKKDPMHAFRSAAFAANTLPRFGFPVGKRYQEWIWPWTEYTAQALILTDGGTTLMPDNQKLEAILAGIDQLFDKDTAATLIVKTVLLHISLPVDPFYPTPAPLTEQETRHFVDPEVLPLLKVMMLSDNEGWSLFEPETRARQRRDTLQAFQKIEQIVSD
jgi:hypothetical protein